MSVFGKPEVKILLDAVTKGDTLLACTIAKEVDRKYPEVIDSIIHQKIPGLLRTVAFIKTEYNEALFKCLTLFIDWDLFPPDRYYNVDVYMSKYLCLKRTTFERVIKNIKFQPKFDLSSNPRVNYKLRTDDSDVNFLDEEVQDIQCNINTLKRLLPDEDNNMKSYELDHFRCLMLTEMYLKEMLSKGKKYTDVFQDKLYQLKKQAQVLDISRLLENNSLIAKKLADVKLK